MPRVPKQELAKDHPRVVVVDSDEAPLHAYHRQRAEHYYQQYLEAQEVVAAYEEKMLEASSGSKRLRKYRLGIDPEYELLAGTRNYYQQLMHNEVAMASLYR